MDFLIVIIFGRMHPQHFFANIATITTATAKTITADEGGNVAQPRHALARA